VVAGKIGDTLEVAATIAVQFVRGMPVQGKSLVWFWIIMFGLRILCVTDPLHGREVGVLNLH